MFSGLFKNLDFSMKYEFMSQKEFMGYILFKIELYNKDKMLGVFPASFPVVCCPSYREPPPALEGWEIEVIEYEALNGEYVKYDLESRKVTIEKVPFPEEMAWKTLAYNIYNLVKSNNLKVPAGYDKILDIIPDNSLNSILFLVELSNV